MAEPSTGSPELDRPHPSTFYYLSSTFSHQFPSLTESSGRPKVSPSGAHLAYFHGSRLIIRSTISRSYPTDTSTDNSAADNDAQVTYLNIKKVVDMASALNNRGLYNSEKTTSAIRNQNSEPPVLVEWDSSYFYANDQTPPLIEDRLAVCIGLYVYVFIFSTDDPISPLDSQGIPSIFNILESANSVIFIPESLLTPSSAPLKPMPLHKVSKANTQSFRNARSPTISTFNSSISICGIQWLQGTTSLNGLADKLVRIAVFIGDSNHITVTAGGSIDTPSTVGNAIAILLCSVDSIDLVIKSPKPGFRIVSVPAGSNSLHSSEMEHGTSLFGILTREFTTDVFLVFDLLANIHSTVPLTLSGTYFQSTSPALESYSFTSPDDDSTFDAKDLQISPSGFWFAVLESPALGYSVSLFSTLTGIHLHTYHGPYYSIPPFLNVEPARSILWTQIPYKDNSIEPKEVLLIADSVGMVTVLCPVSGKPLMTLNHGTGLIIGQEDFAADGSRDSDGDEDMDSSRDRPETQVWYEQVSEETGILQYFGLSLPFDPILLSKPFPPLSTPSVLSKAVASLQRKALVDMSVTHMAACKNFVATVVAGLPSTVFIWRVELEDAAFLGIDAHDSDWHSKSSLLTVLYHSSSIKNLSFRQRISDKESYTNLNSPSRAQLLVTTQEGHVMGIWDTLTYQSSPPDLVELLDLAQEEEDESNHQEASAFTEIARNGHTKKKKLKPRGLWKIQDTANIPKRSSSFDANWVNSIDPNEFGVIAWNRRAFTLFHKIFKTGGKPLTAYLSAAEHLPEEAVDAVSNTSLSYDGDNSNISELMKGEEHSGVSFITSKDDGLARRLEAEVREKEWERDVRVGIRIENDGADDTFAYVRKRNS